MNAACRQRVTPPPAGEPRRRGLTLTELLVSVAILSMMILIASTMLAKSNEMIRVAETEMRANARARAVADRIRQDIQAATPEGLLVIFHDEEDLPHLMLTTVGTYQSLSDPAILAGAARVDIGLGIVKDSQDEEHKVLYRRAILQDTDDPAGSGYKSDHERMSLSYYRYWSLMPLQAFDEWFYDTHFATYTFSTRPMHPDGKDVLPFLMNAPWTDHSVVAPVTLPINSVDQLDRLWPYMLSDVTELKIQWTEGQTYTGAEAAARGDADLAGRLKWYDKDHPKRADWPDLVPINRYFNVTNPMLPADYAVEYNYNKADAHFLAKGDRYCAFFGFERMDKWPRAVRVQFKVGEPARAYDVVVALSDMHQEP